MYQELEADFAATSNSAFANFRLESAYGSFAKLNNGAKIIVNGEELNYVNHVDYNEQNPDSKLEYDYSIALNNVVPSIKFELKRDGRVITNVARRSEISNINIPHTFSAISCGQPIALETVPGQGEVFMARLRKSGLSVSETIYNAEYNQINNTITFFDVPTGTYNLQFLTKVVKPLQQDDNGAGGKLTIYYSDVRTIEVI